MSDSRVEMLMRHKAEREELEKRHAEERAELETTIGVTADDLKAMRPNPDYIEIRSTERILGQARQCAVDYLEALDEENDYESRIHLQNAIDSYMDLDIYLSTSKTAPLPADWQRQ